MATVRVKKAIKNLGNSRTEEQALLAANYSPSYARSGQIKKTKGWEELMEKHLPDKLLAKRHKELLNKRETITRTKADASIEIIDLGPEVQAVSKGLDMGYKLKGRYAAEKHDVRQLIVQIDETIANKHGITEGLP